MNRCRKYKSDKIIYKILENHFDEFTEKKQNRVRREIRQHINNIVVRALNCGNIEKGYIKHKCIECNEEYIHGFTCKSKFCSKCGRKYSLDSADKQVNNMLNVTHRYDVFIIPEKLRNYFYQKRQLLRNLQNTVYRVTSNYYERIIRRDHLANCKSKSCGCLKNNILSDTLRRNWKEISKDIYIY